MRGGEGELDRDRRAGGVTPADFRHVVQQPVLGRRGQQLLARRERQVDQRGHLVQHLGPPVETMQTAIPDVMKLEDEDPATGA